jgi:hypothetical protein
VYRVDRVAGTLHQMTQLDGVTPAGNCFNPALSGDGQRMAFVCNNDQLVPGGTTSTQVYLYDHGAGAITEVSVDAGGGHADSSSGDPALNTDGTLVAFTSNATDLVAGDTNGTQDVFARDLGAGATSRVSLDVSEVSGSSSQPTLGDGTIVAFTYQGDDLVPGGAPGTADVVARAVRIPDVDGFSPQVLAPGAVAELQVTGSHFAPDTVVSIEGSGVTIDDVTVVSATELSVTVTVDPAAPAGKRTLTIEVPGPGPGVGGRTGSFTIRPCLTIS